MSENKTKYRVLKCNFHAHSSEHAGAHIYPHYDAFYYEDLLDKFEEEGYDFLAITEHHLDSSKDSFAQGTKYIKDKNYSLSLLPGYEHKFKDKHEELWIKIANKTLRILCHPFRYKGIDPYWRIEQSQTERCRLVEIGKQLETRPDDLQKLIKFLRDNKLTPISNSDLHGDYINIFRQFTLVIAPEKSEEALKNAILAGNTIAHSFSAEKVQLISGGGPLAEQWLAGENPDLFDLKAADCLSANKTKGLYDSRKLLQSSIPKGTAKVNFQDKKFLSLANDQLQLLFDPQRCGRIISLRHKNSKIDTASYYNGLFKDLVVGEFICEFGEGAYEYEMIEAENHNEILFKSCPAQRHPGVQIEKRYILKNNSSSFEVVYRIYTNRQPVPFRAWIHTSIEKDSQFTQLSYLGKSGKILPRSIKSKVRNNEVNKVIFKNNSQALEFSMQTEKKAIFVCYEGLKEISCEIIFDELTLSHKTALEFVIEVNVFSNNDNAVHSEPDC